MQARLREVRELASGPASVGYVHRLRLQRAVLNVHRAVAAQEKLPLPVRLSDRLAGGTAATVVSDRLAESARRICQPSESLDRRWVAEWEGLTGLVDELEAAVLQTTTRSY